MAIRTWLGRAGLRNQTTTITVGGTAAAANVYNLTINLKTVTYTATVSDTNSTIATALQTALGACLDPEFQAANYSVDGAVITMVANVAGDPYTLSQSVSGTGTLTLNTTIANVSPNDVGNATNWSGATLPVNSDSIVFEASQVPALWNLETTFASNTFAALTVFGTYQSPGRVANPIYSPSGFYEYRGTTFTCAQITNLTVNVSDQAQPGDFKFNVGNSNDCNLLVTGNGTGTLGSEVVWFKGNDANNTLKCFGGSVLCAPLEADRATFATMEVTAGTVRCTAGVTLSGCTITQTGGTVDVTTDVDDWTIEDEGQGAVGIVRGAAAIASLVIDGGNFSCLSTGTITALALGTGAVFDLSGVQGTIIISACTMEAGSSFLDPEGRASMPGGIDLVRCNLSEVTISTRSNVNVVVSNI